MYVPPARPWPRTPPPRAPAEDTRSVMRCFLRRCMRRRTRTTSAASTSRRRAHAGCCAVRPTPPFTPHFATRLTRAPFSEQLRAPWMRIALRHRRPPLRLPALRRRCVRPCGRRRLRAGGDRRGWAHVAHASSAPALVMLPWPPVGHALMCCARAACPAPRAAAFASGTPEARLFTGGPRGEAADAAGPPACHAAARCAARRARARRSGEYTNAVERRSTRRLTPRAPLSSRRRQAGRCGIIDLLALGAQGAAPSRAARHAWRARSPPAALAPRRVGAARRRAA